MKIDFSDFGPVSSHHTSPHLFAAFVTFRYFRVVRNVKNNEKLDLEPRDDYIYARAKAKAIVDRFLESDVAPRLQVKLLPQCF